ncbi:hypothetical protein [Streptomyces mirabilis]|jgi:hypothetical protein|uniref:Transferase n=1 Tax=Streptomyces mirabilis TaxID=68239 RepID=A0A1I2GWW5_9ACTN|nr:hypothetical protein [Streptomyces mirabilis]SFF21738.1 hypothetical protein SAMN02787118_104471 [Streptomyces mirabilis]
MMTPVPPTARHRADPDAAVTPCADCLADSAGGLTFDVTETGEPGAALLVLRRREGHEELSLPLTPTGGGRLRAALPSGVALPEGLWDAYAQVAGGEPRRLAPGVNDLRSLVARVPSGSLGHVAVRIPYATRHGNLSVRSWLRAPHAEAVELYREERGLGVRGRVYGIPLAPDAYAEVCHRDAAGPPIRAEVAVEQAEFGFALAYGALRPGVWDLWLRPAGEGGPRVRIARLLDAIADKRPFLMHPRVPVKTLYGPVEAGPCYTRDNDLSVTVTAAG